jgi:hypothetical protein
MRAVPRIRRIAPAPMRCPSRASSPWMRRCPQRGFSRANRMTRSRSSSSIGGRRRVGSGNPHFRRTSRRCHLSSVPGVTTRCQRSSRSNSRVNADKTARSEHDGRGFPGHMLANETGDRGWRGRRTKISADTELDISSPACCAPSCWVSSSPGDRHGERKVFLQPRSRGRRVGLVRTAGVVGGGHRRQDRAVRLHRRREGLADGKIVHPPERFQHLDRARAAGLSNAEIAVAEASDSAPLDQAKQVLLRYSTNASPKSRSARPSSQPPAPRSRTWRR